MGFSFQREDGVTGHSSETDESTVEHPLYHKYRMLYEEKRQKEVRGHWFLRDRRVCLSCLPKKMLFVQHADDVSLKLISSGKFDQNQEESFQYDDSLKPVTISHEEVS